MKETGLPSPAKGELLVKVSAALTCGTDLKAYLRGHKLIPMPGPFGHEFSGVVAQAGPGVRRFREGDGIMAVHTAPCRSCAYCRRGFYNLCENIMETKVLGAFGEYLLLPARVVRDNTFIKPKKLSFGEAAFLEPLSCVVHGVNRLAIKDKAKKTALIFGAGPIGLLHLILLKAGGLRAAVCALEEERLALARRLGADAATKPDGLARAVKEFSPGGVDYAIECTGRREVWESAPDHVRRGGSVMLFGGLKKGTPVQYLAERIHYDELALMASFHFCPRDVREAFGLLESGGVDVKPLISGVYPLEETEEALRKLSAGDGIKYVIDPRR
ncbi:MAG: alcohol dehydrogenase catalytic domain-containing protein [Nitrospiraceae bacterium]|nr:alcohol dehydrogenase catalytic domain-containing protein [Nitrospiraceae bacterium]